GRGGEAITLVSPREFRSLRQIERATRAKIEPKRLPSQEDVNTRRLEMMTSLVHDAVEDEDAYAAYRQPIESLVEELDPSQMAAALLKLYADETGRGLLETGRHDELANFGGKMDRKDRGRDRDRGPRQGGSPRGGEAGMTRLFINIGHNFQVRP